MKANILWEGRISINDIKINFSRNNDYKLSETELNRADNIWEKEKSKFPHIYNGNLIYVASMNSNSPITFTTGIMKYSDLIYLARTNNKFKELRGYLSFKIILKINDGSTTKYLVGMKSSGSEFDPSNWTMPGGVVEEKGGSGVDLFHSIHKEITEETGLNNINDNLTCHLLTKGGRNLGIGMIISLEINHKLKDEIRENEEFEPLSFTWMTNNEILELDDEQILDDVASLKYLITKDLI